MSCHMNICYLQPCFFSFYCLNVYYVAPDYTKIKTEKATVTVLLIKSNYYNYNLYTYITEQTRLANYKSIKVSKSAWLEIGKAMEGYNIYSSVSSACPLWLSEIVSIQSRYGLGIFIINFVSLEV